MVVQLQGLDPDRWFDHVERAMLFVSDPAVHRNTRYGFVHDKELAGYVLRINDLGLMYFRLLPE